MAVSVAIDAAATKTRRALSSAVSILLSPASKAVLPLTKILVPIPRQHMLQSPLAVHPFRKPSLFLKILHQFLDRSFSLVAVVHKLYKRLMGGPKDLSLSANLRRRLKRTVILVNTRNINPDQIT